MGSRDEMRSRWNKLTTADHGYIRVDATHPLEWHIGYERSRHRTLLLVSPVEPPRLPSSRSIEVFRAVRADGQWALQFRLINSGHEDVFMRLCWDLVDSSREKPPGRMAMQFISRRYLEWSKLFQKGVDGLSRAQQKGLIGELFCLRTLLESAQLTATQAVSAWGGPDGADRDFVVGEWWCEVKTIGGSATTVQISSLEQLDINPSGELLVYVIESTTPGDADGFTLNSVAEQVGHSLGGDVDAGELYAGKLIASGYVRRDEYDEMPYRLVGTARFYVDSTFPRLTRRMVPSQVVAAKYELALGTLEPWKTK